jgi:hypothetical protein
MKQAILRALPPSRITRARDTPRASPRPTLHAAKPPPPAPVRLTLRAPVTPPQAPRSAPVETPIATAVGILGAGGTRVIMVPAELTQPGLVNITQFRVAIAAGVW